MIHLLHLRRLLHPLIGLFIASLNAGNGQEVNIRVAILENVQAVMISGVNIEAESGERHWNPDDGEIDIRAYKSGLKVIGKIVREPVRVKAEGDMLYVNGRQYRGEMVVYNNDGAGLMVIDEIPLETYLVGLINAEAHSSWPREAIKAQAVAARSYALCKINRSRSKPFDIRATVSDQVYLGSSLEDPASEDAVQSTRGEVVVYNGEVAETFYHSTCGGRTADVSEVWGGSTPYLKSVECEWCQDSPRYFWRYEGSGDDLGEALKDEGVKLGRISGMEVIAKTPSGRNDAIRVSGDGGIREIKAAILRKAIGYNKIFSTLFDVLPEGDGMFVFLGRGSGHGVGMCQWGARGMALEGKTHSEILLYYYNGCTIEKAY